MKDDGTHFLLDILIKLIVNLQFLLLVVKLFFTNSQRRNRLITGVTESEITLGVPFVLVRVQYVSGEPDVGRIESTENGTHFCFVASRFRTPCQFLLALRVYPSPNIPVIHKIAKMTDLE